MHTDRDRSHARKTGFRSVWLRCLALIMLFIDGLLLVSILNASAANALGDPSFQAQWQHGESVTPII